MVTLLKFLSLVIWILMVACLIFRPGSRATGRQVKRWDEGTARARKRGYRIRRLHITATPSGVPGTIKPICPV